MPSLRDVILQQDPNFLQQPNDDELSQLIRALAGAGITRAAGQPITQGLGQGARDVLTQARTQGIAPAGNTLQGMAVDAVIDSVSVATTFKEELHKHGIIFCSFGEAVKDHPELVQKYLGTVVPTTDNFYAALNSAVFTEGSFCYIPPGVKCPMELSTYFRINAAGTGQFERTLLIADAGSYVSYL